MTEVRTDWTREEIAALFDLQFTELLFQAATVHREKHPPAQRSSRRHVCRVTLSPQRGRPHPRGCGPR